MALSFSTARTVAQVDLSAFDAVEVRGGAVLVVQYADATGVTFYDDYTGHKSFIEGNRAWTVVGRDE